MKYTTLIILIFATLLCSCHKKATLPAISTVGANVLACKVDGKIYTVTGFQENSLNSFGVIVLGPTNYGMFDIIATGENPRLDFDIAFIYSDTLGTYPIITNYPLGASFTLYTNGSVAYGSNTYRTDSIHTGTIKIIHKDLKILAGTFEFDAMNQDGKIVHITEGRFDINIK